MLSEAGWLMSGEDQTALDLATVEGVQIIAQTEDDTGLEPMDLGSSHSSAPY